MSRSVPKSWLFAASLLLPLSAAAAFSSATTRALNVRGGPSPFFEVQAVLAANTPVRVIRCTAGWHWCEITSRRVSGWVDSRFLRPSVHGRVPLVRDRGPGRQRSRPIPQPQRPVG